jgi:hypothetical protein
MKEAMKSERTRVGAEDRKSRQCQEEEKEPGNKRDSRVDGDKKEE